MSGSFNYIRFIIALLFAAMLMYGDLSLKWFENLRGQMSLVLVPFRTAAELPSQTYNGMYDYFRARDGLLTEKTQLEEQLRENNVRLKSLDFFVRQNDELRTVLGLKERLDKSSGQWQSAELSHSSSQQSANRIFLNKGTTDGVFPGMSVVDDFGVMGQIIRGDAQTSVVNLITDSRQWISARVGRNQLLVILRGDGDGKLRVEYAPNSTDLRVDDKLFSAGGAFPPGYPIAIVDEVADGIVYKEVTARPLSTFWDNTAVLVYLVGDKTETDGSFEEKQ